MKKILLGLVLMSLLIVPMLVLAQAPVTCTPRESVDGMAGLSCPSAGTPCPYDHATYDCAMCCIVSTLLWVTNWIFMIIMIVVVMLILVGAFTLITASGSEEGVKKGRTYIVFAMIGVAVALLAKALPYIVGTILGV